GSLGVTHDTGDRRRGRAGVHRRGGQRESEGRSGQGGEDEPFHIPGPRVQFGSIDFSKVNCHRAWESLKTPPGGGSGRSGRRARNRGRPPPPWGRNRPLRTWPAIEGFSLRRRIE